MESKHPIPKVNRGEVGRVYKISLNGILRPCIVHIYLQTGQEIEIYKQSQRRVEIHVKIKHTLTFILWK